MYDEIDIDYIYIIIYIYILCSVCFILYMYMYVYVLYSNIIHVIYRVYRTHYIICCIVYLFYIV